jgi:catechol-2,3-dioxygenase
MDTDMSISALQASAYLHHLHLHSPDAARLARFYCDVMDMRAESLHGVGWLVRGPARRLLFSNGPAGSLAHAGFALRDRDGLEGLRARAEEKGLRAGHFATPFFREGAFSVTDPDGNVVVFGLAAGEPPAPRGIRARIQHLTLATMNVRAIEEFYADKLGFGVSDRVLGDKGEVMICFMRGNHEHHNLACFYQDRQGIDHHSYEAGEWNTIRDWCDHFAERGVQLTWGPGRHGPGNNLFIFIVDPDGNWIEVSAELEVVHGRAVTLWPHADRTLNLWGRGRQPSGDQPRSDPHG